MRRFAAMAVLMLSCAGLGVSQPQVQPADNSAEPSSATPPTTVYKVGGGVTPPVLLKSAEPTWSNKARRRRIDGRCLIALVVGTDGHPQDIHIIRSLAENLTGKDHAAALELDQSALAAVEKYRFAPSQMNRKAVPVSINVEVNFKLLN